MVKSLLRTFVENRAPVMSAQASGRRGSTALAGSGHDLVGTEGQMRAYGQVGVLFAIVSRLAESVAEAEWALYRIGAPDDQPLKTHPAALLWDKPNPHMDQETFVETTMQHFDLAGEGAWYVGRSDSVAIDMPLELWPIRPDRVTPVPHRDRFIEGWVYTPPGGDREPWRVDEVIQMKRPNPLDPYRGLSPVAAAMIDVYGERAAAEYNSMFFRNSAEPGGIIKFAERQDDDVFEEFVERWRSQHQGVGNAHRIAVIEGADWIERKYTMRDMQFEELRKLNREFIRQAFGYPKSMLGDTEDVNKASAIAGEYVFVRWMIKTRLNRLRSTLNGKLLPLFGNSAKGLEFRYVTPVPADKELEILELDSRANRAKTLIEAGYDPDDVAKYVGLPPMAFREASEAPAGAGVAPEPTAEPTARRGRPPVTDDLEARATWEDAQDYWRSHPTATLEVVSGIVGVSERTLRRYRDKFSA